MRVLAIAPHADDAEFGCGGTIAKAARNGHEVTVCLVSASDIRMRHSGERVQAQVRMAEQQRACRILGADCRLLGSWIENEYGRELPRMITALDELLAELAPDQLFIPLPSFNQDHQAVFDACIAATRPTRIQPGLVAAYEYPGNGHGPGGVAGPIAGKMFVAFGEDLLDLKLDALHAHRSQIAGREDALMGLQGARTLARFRGLECGHAFAEMFHVIRQVHAP